MSCLRTRQIPRVVLSHSDPLAIILDVRNVVAQQAVASGDVEELAVAQRIQPAAESADPQRAVGAFHQRANLIARKTVGDGVEQLLSSPVIEPPQALAVGAGPQAAIARFAQHHGIVVELRSARNHDARPACLRVRSRRPE